MKALYMLILSMFIGLGVNASPSAISSGEPAQEPSNYSPQVCQFSLSSYSGQIQSGYTSKFTVGLSCPQNDDVYATVVVTIAGELVASEVVKVPAGKTRSNDVNIFVGGDYNGQTYKLGVQ